MIVSIADTHTAVWYLFNDPRLSTTAREFIEQSVRDGQEVGVSSISIAEMVYLCEKNRIQPSAVQNLIDALADADNVLTELPVTSAVARHMQDIPREEVSDMPDRIIAATSLRLRVPVISRDAKIRAAQLQTIW
jgi:PIN domain nuclease of toxin-antitoxin system